MSNNSRSSLEMKGMQELENDVESSPNHPLMTPKEILENDLKTPSSASCDRKEPTTTVRREKVLKVTLRECGGFFRKHMLPLLTISGVFGGVALGFILRYSRGGDPSAWTKRDIMYAGYLGELFLRALKALIIPLIVSSLVSAIGNLDISMSRKIGLRAITYYMTTTVSAVILGIILVVSIHPGRGSEEGITRTGEARISTTPDLLMDLIRNLFPPNIVQAAFQSYRTKLVPPSIDSNDSRITIWYERYSNWTGVPMDLPKEEWDIKGEYINGLNIMGLVIFSTALGIAFAKLGPKGKPLLNMFDALTAASMVITTWIIWISPIGILFLVAKTVLEMKDFGVMLGQLGMYLITILIGIFIHGFLFLPALYAVFTKSLPFKFLANMTPAFVTAFATGSSSGTLPVTLKCMEEKNKIDSRVTRFLIPIGATINMDGTALYEAVAAIFIAQVRGIPLSIGNIIAISITATAAAIGAAGIPHAGLVTLVMVLDVVGLPAEDVALIIAVDWLVDRFRTLINVLGDSVGAGIVYKMSKGELKELDEIQKKNEVERANRDASDLNRTVKCEKNAMFSDPRKFSEFLAEAFRQSEKATSNSDQIDKILGSLKKFFDEEITRAEEHQQPQVNSSNPTEV